MAPALETDTDTGNGAGREALASEPAARSAAPGAASTPAGFYDRAGTRALDAGSSTAIVLSLLWITCCGLALFVLPLDQGHAANRLEWLLTAIVMFLPVAMIWVISIMLRTTRILREESLRMQTAVDAIRKSSISQSQRGVAEPTMSRKLDEIAATARRTEAALTMVAKDRVAAAPEASRDPATATGQDATGDQPSLALGTLSEDHAPPLATSDFIRALNFPETTEDTEGFAALHRALKDRTAAQLVQASQDVLTLMSQDGIYMDDLRPDLARTEVWRDFADGTRGKAVAALGSIRDRSSLALVSGRMKQDPIFRDAAHHYLRVFDRVFSGFAARATDAEIQAFATTRTARAFMLLGRVAGTFD